MPGKSKLIRTRVGNGHLGFANGVIGFGYQIGPAVGTFTGGILMARLGWRPIFMAFGALSLLWLFPWARVHVHEKTINSTGVSADAPRFGTILRQRALWGGALGNFGLNYSFFFTLAWLPTDRLPRRRGVLGPICGHRPQRAAARRALLRRLRIEKWFGRAARDSLLPHSHLTGAEWLVAADWEVALTVKLARE